MAVQAVFQWPDVFPQRTTTNALPYYLAWFSVLLVNHYTAKSVKVSQAHTGAVTLIQRFGSALNLKMRVIPRRPVSQGSSETRCWYKVKIRQPESDVPYVSVSPPFQAHFPKR